MAAADGVGGARRMGHYGSARRGHAANVDGCEWGTKRAGEDFLNIFLDSDAHFGNYENTSDDLRRSKTVAQLP